MRQQPTLLNCLWASEVLFALSRTAIAAIRNNVVPHVSLIATSSEGLGQTTAVRALAADGLSGSHGALRRFASEPAIEGSVDRTGNAPHSPRPDAAPAHSQADRPDQGGRRQQQQQQQQRHRHQRWHNARPADGQRDGAGHSAGSADAPGGQPSASQENGNGGGKWGHRQRERGSWEWGQGRNGAAPNGSGDGKRDPYRRDRPNGEHQSQHQSQGQGQRQGQVQGRNGDRGWGRGRGWRQREDDWRPRQSQYQGGSQGARGGWGAGQGSSQRQDADTALGSLARAVQGRSQGGADGGGGGGSSGAASDSAPPTPAAPNSPAVKALLKFLTSASVPSTTSASAATSSPSPSAAHQPQQPRPPRRPSPIPNAPSSPQQQPRTAPSGLHPLGHKPSPRISPELFTQMVQVFNRACKRQRLSTGLPAALASLVVACGGRGPADLSRMDPDRLVDLLEFMGREQVLNRQLLELLHPALQPCWGTHTPEQLVNLLYSLSVLYDTDRLASLGRPVGRGHWAGRGGGGGGSGGGGPGSARHLLLLFDAEPHVRALLVAGPSNGSGSSSNSSSSGSGDEGHGDGGAVTCSGSGGGGDSSSNNPLAVEASQGGGEGEEGDSTTAAGGVNADREVEPHALSAGGKQDAPAAEQTADAGPAGLRAALAALHLPASGTAAAPGGASSPATLPAAGLPPYGRARLARAYLAFYTCAMSGVQHFSVAHSLLETLALCLSGLDPADPRVIAGDDLGLLVHGLAGVASYPGHVLAPELMRLARAAHARSPEMQPHVRALLAALPADHWALPPTATWRAAMAPGEGHVAPAAGAAAGAGSGGREGVRAW